MRLFIAAFAALACLIMVVSCLQPRKWPIPELTVPAAAPPAQIPLLMVEDDWRPFLAPDGTRTVEAPNVYSWIRGFNYAQGWEALIRHVERAILPIGYQPYSGPELPPMPDIPGVPDGTMARAWISPDAKYLVAVLNVAFIKDRDAGQIRDTEADFLLFIDQIKDLPPELQQKFDSGR